MTEEYKIIIEDVASFRKELIYMIEQIMFNIGEYEDLTSTDVAEKFEHKINDYLKTK